MNKYNNKKTATYFLFCDFLCFFSSLFLLYVFTRSIRLSPMYMIMNPFITQSMYYAACTLITYPILGRKNKNVFTVNGVYENDAEKKFGIIFTKYTNTNARFLRSFCAIWLGVYIMCILPSAICSVWISMNWHIYSW